MRRDLPHTLERLLNLRRGDLPRGLLLFLHMLVVMCCYVVGQVVRDALFLDRFQAARLPYADISVFLLVGVVVALYIRAGQRASLLKLLVGSSGLFALSFLLLFFLALDHSRAWLYPVLYVIVGIFGVLAPAQVWTLANCVLAPREAKRLFGLLGGGATLGAAVAGFLSSAVATRLGAESLLLVMSALLALGAGLAGTTWRLKPAGLEDASVLTGEQPPGTLRESAALVLSSPALTAIAGLIAISSFATSLATWQLKAIAQQTLTGKEALAHFFGTFNAWVGVLSLLTQLLLTSRLLKRFELGSVLLILPVSLVGGSGAVLVWGTLSSAVVLKLIDKVVRYAIDRPAAELLYLPLPAGLKVPVKSFIDTVVWRSGDGLAGVAILIFAGLFHLSPRRLSLVALAALAGWLYLAFVNRRLYVSMLRESIHKHRLDAERATALVLDRSATEMLAARLESVDPKEIVYALDLFTVGQHAAEHPAVRGLLKHPTAEVRERAIAILNAAGDKSVAADVETLLHDPDLSVRTEALLYLARQANVDPVTRVQELGDFPDFSIRAAVVAVLARGGDNLEAAQLMFEAMASEPGPEAARTRLEAARLATELPDALLGPVARLILDPDLEVARAAIHAAAQSDPLRFLDALATRLGDPVLRAEAADAIASLGEPALPALAAALASDRTPARVRREIPAVLVRLGTPRVDEALAACLLETDTTLRLRAISGLNKLVQVHPGLKIDEVLVETVLTAEIMGHYRSYQVLGLLQPGLDDSPSIRGLRDAMSQEVERIFRLLSLLFPRHDFHSAHVALRSRSLAIHDHSLDFLESVLRPELRALLLPLIDTEVSMEERVRLANQWLGAPVVTPEQAVSALAGSGDPWLRSCAAYAIGALRLTALEPLLDRLAEDPDPLLRETVRQARERLSEAGR